MLPKQSNGGRVHVVLIPGFAGFDALGQLEYYAGITSVFNAWKTAAKDRHVVLHYFDNFPTAAVAMRATRLRQYLAKRIARCEFMPHDRLVLVGHSTGGLDIRRLLWDLAEQRDGPIRVDGGREAAVPVPAPEILRMVHGIVFLSVPQWGTNIADWVHTYTVLRKLVIAELRVSVAATQVPVLDLLEDWFTRNAASLTDTDLFLAIQDALNEAESGVCGRDPARLSDAREAASELGLWLRHTAADFGAIDDLRAQPPAGEPVSPAHFNSERRAQEIALWNSYGIRTRSYATLGPCPFRFAPGSPAPRWDLLKLWTYPECMKDRVLSAKTDIVYRTCYRACAGGPFAYPRERGFVPVATCLGSQEQRHIEVWDNDGIVNTASMLWPDGAGTYLVDGDHEDIVGHHRRLFSVPGHGRTYEAYDLLGSGSEFEATFVRVWKDVFAFCAG